MPHSGISGSTPACGSPKLFAANHVLHRLLAPRHPPNALTSLTTKLVWHRPPVTRVTQVRPREWRSKPRLDEQLASRRSARFLGGFPLSGFYNCPLSRFVLLFSCHEHAAARPVGQERFELSTPRLSSVCSNQLSYWPVFLGLSRPNSGRS